MICKLELIHIFPLYKYRPRTKFFNVELYHFRYYVNIGETTILKIRTEDQPADYLTRPLYEQNNVNNMKEVNVW